MQYFIGIVPPKETQDKVVDFQRRNRRNLYPKQVEPHITIKAQGGLSADELWLPAVREAVKNFKSFEVGFGGIGYFDDRVLWIEAKSDELFKLQEALVKAVNPPEEIVKEYHEDKFHSHMTLGIRDKKFADADLLLAGEVAKKELTNLPSFKAEFVRVYRRSEFGPYLKMEDIPFGN